MTIRLMLVDDHEVVRIGMKTLLETQHNFSIVAEAESEDEAVDIALHYEPDVVLMDIRLKQGSGIEACRRIVEVNPAIRVVMLTSYAEDELLFAAIRAGATGYVLKQIGGGQLAQAIESAARGDGTLDPSLTQHIFREVRHMIIKNEENAFAELRERELRVLELIAQGQTNQLIADSLQLSKGTVRNYVSNILSKLGVSNRAEAAAYAIQYRLQDYLAS